MRTLLNIIWLVLAGVWLALGYCIAAVLMAITIIGLPFAKQALKLAGYALWPFGRVLVPSSTRHKGLSVVGNVLWFILAGWWLALEHLIVGILLCITIIGIPLGVGAFKMSRRGTRSLRQRSSSAQRPGGAGRRRDRRRLLRTVGWSAARAARPLTASRLREERRRPGTAHAGRTVCSPIRAGAP